MKLCALLCLVAFVLRVTPLMAQGNATDPSRGPDAGTEIRVHGIQVLPATGRAFSGRDHIEWTRKLEDGTVVQTQLYALVARDSQGRIYREHRTFVPVNTNRESRQIDMVLLDPVAHTRTTCILARHRCEITAYRASSKFVQPPDGLLDKGTRYLSRESLGTSVMNDLNVVGTRETLYIAAGTVGNSQPLVGTREFWYSPDLQINLSVTRKNPAIGTQVLEIVDFSRSEPDPGIFKLPTGFVVRDLR